MSRSIRAYRDTDQRAVVELWRQAFGNASSHNDPVAKIGRKVAQRDELFSVATINKQIVGTIMAGYDGVRGWIYALAVSREFQRQRIGSELIAYAEKQLRDRSCVKVNLQVVEPVDTGLIRFYEQAGFAVEPRTSLGKVL